jgi:hypothetical protein
MEGYYYKKNLAKEIFESIIHHIDKPLPILFFIFTVLFLFQEKNQKSKSAIGLIIFSVYWICEILLIWLWKSFIYPEMCHIMDLIPLAIPIFLFFYAISSFFPNNKILHESTSVFLLITSCIWILFFFSGIYYYGAPSIWFEYIYMLSSPLQINIPILFIILVLSFFNKKNPFHTIIEFDKPALPKQNIRRGNAKISKYFFYIIGIILFPALALYFLMIYPKDPYKNMKPPKVTYYMYDFCERNWVIERHALSIMQTQVNDSVYQLQITNHKQCRKEFYCAVNYDRLIYQKITPEGIYFATDSINYELHYSFIDNKPVNIAFSVFGFFKKDYDIYTIQNDTISLYREKPVYIYTESPGKYRTVFVDSLNLPLFCKDFQTNEYYILSDILGEGEGINPYIPLTDGICKNTFFFGRTYYNEPDTLFPSSCYYEEVAALRRYTDSDSYYLKKKMEEVGLTQEDILNDKPYILIDSVSDNHKTKNRIESMQENEVSIILKK